MRYLASTALGLVLLAATPVTAAPAPAHYAATITRTTFGIPHIRATTWGGLGYGVAYAYAQDNLCMLAEEFATVAGERSRWFGPKESAVLGFEKIDNLSSDVFFRSVIDVPTLRAGMARGNPTTRALVRGYVAGYNKLLRDIGPAGVPSDCRGKGWVRPITLDDMLRLNEKQMLLASSLALAPLVVHAVPPGAAQAALVPGEDPLRPRDIGFGSNGWAFGKDVTANGRGLVVGNPHFPWNGPSRFYEMHLTLPGQYDAMGVGIAGAPVVTLGFNKDVAWTHTVTAAQHFTVFQLKLDPADPTKYLIDGKSEAMGRQVISVPMPDGAPPVERTTYATRYGPIVYNPLAGFGWTKTQAYALRDANHNNQRALETWVAIGQARSVGEVRAAVERTLGIPWVNTIAADRAGNALHADVTAVPNLSADKVRECGMPLSAVLKGKLILLDGSRSACDWDRAAGTPVAGLMPARDQAVLERQDYVANSNDSYWLSNPKVPALIRSPILGTTESERTLRTRSGLIEIDRRLSGSDGLPGTKVDPAAAEAMAFANKSLAAELAVDPLLALCRGQEDVAAACAALSGWDRRFNLDSRGAYLFATFWEGVRSLPGLWAVPFDKADPVHTPRDFVTSGAQGAKLLAALKAAAATLAKQGIALDARWGEVQFAVRGQDHIPIHGASGQLGVLNVQQSDAVPGGIVPKHGSSYVQIVTFDTVGPVADALLSYSQSTDPASPYFGDQTREFSAKRFHHLPFTEAQILADGGHKSVRISE
ncbi:MULTISPECIES: penicillin acylase family protein [Sphingomonas]|jgi:acyl-homoserine-lactone acylase|uniref:penicillin acylase family protein n=3 Tax=Pseudomonadota TaxID=1224 RepID=UPI001AE64348